jgi:hypothetical protein
MQTVQCSAVQCSAVQCSAVQAGGNSAVHSATVAAMDGKLHEPLLTKYTTYLVKLHLHPVKCYLDELHSLCTRFILVNY